ncbi:MAG: sodium transporter [Calditrichaeota bacterium]|nr:MAG: sodium transporter [Calditrichota bacterium]
MKLNAFDWSILIGYFAILFFIGLYFSKRQKNSAEYFLAGRKSKWFAIGSSVFAANISSEHLIGLAGSGAATGLAVGAYEWMAVFCLFTLIWLFLPNYLKSRVFTMPEFLERRFSPECRWYLTFISILAYIFTKISVSLFAGAIILKFVLGWDTMLSATILVIFTGLYAIAGGLSAVIFADMIQAAVLIMGSALLTLIGLHRIGGFAELRQALPHDFFDMLRPASDPVYPWPGVIFGIFILGIWYWATDQYIVQKTLSAKNLDHARAGGNLAALYKILPVFIFVLPGLIARVLWSAEVGADPDSAYPLLLTRLLPPGLSGLVLAALLAALISSLCAVFNSCSSLFTMDIYRKLKPDADEKHLVQVGRLFTGSVVVIGILWIPFIRLLNNQIYQYLQSVQAYTSPPIAAVFLMGVLWKRTTAKAAFATLVTGGILGLFRFVLDLLAKSHDIGLLHKLVNIPFLYYCILLFVVCLVLLVSLSLATPKPDYQRIKDLVIGPMSNAGKLNKSDVINIAFSAFVALSVILLWAYFA